MFFRQTGIWQLHPIIWNLLRCFLNACKMISFTPSNATFISVPCLYSTSWFPYTGTRHRGFRTSGGVSLWIVEVFGLQHTTPVPVSCNTSRPDLFFSLTARNAGRVVATGCLDTVFLWSLICVDSMHCSSSGPFEDHSRLKFLLYLFITWPQRTNEVLFQDTMQWNGRALPSVQPPCSPACKICMAMGSKLWS